MKALILKGVKKAIPEDVKDALTGKSYYVVPYMYGSDHDPTHEAFVVDVSDDDVGTIKDSLTNIKVSFLPLCDSDGTLDAIVEATLRDYGYTIHKKG